MPPVVGAITAFLATELIAGFVTVGTIAKAVLAVAATALTAALQPKPKAPAGTQIRISQRDPQAVRDISYGRVRKGGAIVFMTTTNNQNHLHMVIALAGRKCNAIKEIYFDDELAFDADGNVQKKFRNKAFLSKHLGDPDQLADTELINRVPEWTSAHRLRGICYIYLRLISDPDKYTSVPNVTANLEGAEVFDPRDGQTKYTDNAALCIADYMNDAQYGLNIPYNNVRGIDPNELMAAANLCDELVMIPGGTERRYTLNGVVQSNQPPERNIEEMLTSCAGTINYVGGKWFVSPGQFTAAEADFTIDDLRSGLEVQTGLAKRDLCNAIRGQFLSEKDKFIPVGFPPITSAAFEAQDNGERIWRDISLPYTITETEAQRLARIELFSTREQISVSGAFGLKALAAKVGDVVTLTIERMGWTQKPFRVTRWKLAIREEGDAPELVVEMDLRETSSAVFDYTASDLDLLAAAPDTELPTPDTIGGGTIFTLPSQPGSVILSYQANLTGQGRITMKEQFPAWTGDSFGLVRNPLTGHMVIDDQTLAGADNFFVFDEFVQNPVPVSFYESLPIALRFEDNVRITGGFRIVRGPGQTGSFSAHVEYDFHGDLDDFDGLERIGATGVQTVQATEFIMRIAINATPAGGFILERFSPQAWKEAIVQGDTSVLVPPGGRTIEFTRPYHNVPRISVQAVVSGERVAVIQSRTGDEFTMNVFDPVLGDTGGLTDWRAEGV